jgi:hypothetical protein
VPETFDEKCGRDAPTTSATGCEKVRRMRVSGEI